MKDIPVRKVIIGSLILAAGGLWAIHQINTNRESKRLTTLAAAYLAKNERHNAAECLITALSIYPGNSEARRLLLEIAPNAPSANSSSPPPIPQASSPQLIVQPPPQTNPNPIVVEVPAPLPAPTPPDPAKVDAHLAKAHEFLAADNSIAAEKELRAAVTLDATDKSKSELANFLLKQPVGSTDTNELVSLLRELGRNQTSIGAEALSTGAVRGIVPQAEIEGWLTLLRSHPAATTSMLLTVDRLDALLHPRNQSSIAENAAKRLRTAPLQDRETAMRWLASIGEYSLATSLLSLEEAQKDRYTLESWLVSQSHAKNFDAVLAATASPSTNLPAHTQKIFRGNALANSGNPTEGLQLMRDACEETGTSRSELVEALAILAIIHSHSLFEEELAKAFSDPDTSAELVDTLAPLVHLCGNAVVIRRFYEIAAAAPALRGDDRIASTRDHFRLLLGLDVDIDELARRAEIARDPAPRITYIHALLNKGQSPKALLELEDNAPPINPARLNISQKTVAAATFAANNRLPEAFSILAQIPQDQLTIQERDWLRSHFDAASKSARAASATSPLDSRYPWLPTARRIGIDLGALLALFVTWKIAKRSYLWLLREAVG